MNGTITQKLEKLINQSTMFTIAYIIKKKKKGEEGLFLNQYEVFQETKEELEEILGREIGTEQENWGAIITTYFSSEEIELLQDYFDFKRM